MGLDRIQLVSSVYLLATCVAMLPFGRLGDVRGKVNVFQLGVIVFSVGSAVAFRPRSRFLSWHALFRASVARRPWLTTWVSSPSRFRTRTRPCHGVLATFVALGMMCGPVLGGMLVASFPRESIFLINLPIGVISFIVGPLHATAC